MAMGLCHTTNERIVFMNLREFMDLADQTAADMKEEKLKEFVHNLARKIPEEKREAFLELMRETKKNGPVSFDKKEKKEKEQDLELKKKLSRIREDFAEIEKEEIKICAQSYEEYESNCWDGDWEWEYYDYDQVEEIYGDAYKLLRQCVDCGLYAEALELSDLLIQTQVSVDGDGDRFDLGLQDLVSEEIVRSISESWHCTRCMRDIRRRRKKSARRKSIRIFRCPY